MAKASKAKVIPTKSDKKVTPPKSDRVIIKPNPAETVTAGGIIIPDTAQEKPQKGIVVAVGPGKYAEMTGTLIPMTICVGDLVYYGKYAGTEINIDGEDYLIMRESDILI